MYPGLKISYARSALQNENQLQPQYGDNTFCKENKMSKNIVMPTLVLNRKFVSRIWKNHWNPTENDEILKEKTQSP